MHLCFLHQVYKQKVKHVLCEHENMILGFKADAVVSAEARQKEQEVIEAEIYTEKEAITVDLQDVDSEKLALEIELVCGTQHLLQRAFHH